MEQLNKLLECNSFFEKIGYEKKDVLSNYTQYLNRSEDSISIINLYLFKKEIVRVTFNKEQLVITKYPIALLDFKFMQNTMEARYSKSKDKIIIEDLENSIKLGKDIDIIVKKPIKELEEEWLEDYADFNKKLYNLLLEIN